MRLRNLLACGAASCMLLTGCAVKSYAVLIESPDGSTGAIVVSNANGSTLINQKQRALALDGTPSEIFTVGQDKMDDDFAAALSAQPVLPQSFLMYFENATAILTPESQALIPSVIETVRKRGQVVIAVTGHTDTVGDGKLNDKLSLERAHAVVALLKASDLKAIEYVVSHHGKRNLLIKTPDNTPEPRNRRVEITVR